MKVKILSLFLILAMLASCFVACGDDKEESKDKGKDNKPATENNISGEESGDEYISVDFESLTDSREKLVYLSGAPEGYVSFDDKVYDAMGVEDGDVTIPAITKDSVYKIATSLNLTEATEDGKDVMKDMFGGAMGYSFTALTDGSLLNLDADVNFMGNSVNMDLKAGDNGVLISSPFIFTNPVFVDGEYINGLAAGYSNMSGLIDSFANLSDGIVDASDKVILASFLRSKAVELIPESAVTTEKATISGNYNSGEVETDSVVLTLNGDQLAVILSGFRQSMENDAIFKQLVSGFLGDFGDLIAMGLMAVEGTDEIPTLSDTELYDAIFDFTDELAEELKGNTDLTIVFKRYFLNGVDTRWDFELTAGGQTLKASNWDIYVDNANDYGFTLSLDAVSFEVTGCNKGDEAEFKAVMSAEGQKMSFATKRDGEDFDLDVNIIDQTIIDYNQKADTFRLTLYNNTEEGQEIEINGTIIEKDDGTTVNGRMEMGDDDLEFTCSTKNEVTANKVSCEMDIEITVEVEDVINVMKFEMETVIDSDSGETLVEPLPGSDDVVIDSDEDIMAIQENFTAAFIGLLDIMSSGEEDVVEDVSIVEEASL